MTTIDPTKDLTSLGNLVAQLQVSTRTIERAATAIGIAPEMKLNGVAYFTSEQVDRLAAHLHNAKGN